MKLLLNNDFHQNSCYTQIAHVEQQSSRELYTVEEPALPEDIQDFEHGGTVLLNPF